MLSSSVTGHMPITLAAAFSGWGIAGIVVAIFQALGLFQIASREREPHLSVLGLLWLITTAVVAYYWKTSGPLAWSWVFGPYIVLGILFGTMGHQAQQTHTHKMGCSSALNVGVVWIIVYFASGSKPPEQAARPEVDSFRAFWTDNVLHSEHGYLTSSKFIPLRAIARRPNPNLYTKPDSENAGDVGGVMDAWAPYYVFANTEKSLLVATQPGAKQEERMWALVKDCFCWTTRECLNIEKPVTIYKALEDAKAGKNALDTKYVYPFKEHFTPADKKSKKRGFAMASLPIFANVEGKYFGFVRPEGTSGLYEMCWLAWDGQDGDVECRLRVSRREFEQFIVGIRGLMTDYQNIEKKADAKKSMYADAQEHIMQVKRPQGSEVDVNMIKTRNEGIPRLDGYLQRPIESELEYDKVKTSVLKMMEMSNNNDLWDNDDVSFIKLSEMP